MYAHTHSRSFRLSALAAVVLGLGATPALGAGYSAAASAGSGTINVPGPSTSDVYPTSPAPGSANSVSAITIGPVGSTTEGYMDAASSGIGSASTGAAHASASARAETGLPPAAGSANAQSSASATGTFSDVFALSAAGFTDGTTVRLTFGLDVHGGFGGDGSTVGGGILSASGWTGSAFWRATTQVSSYGFEQGQSLFRNSTGDLNLTGTGHFGTSVYTIEVPLGLTSVLLRAEAGATATASAFAHASDPMLVAAEAAFASDLSDTVGWGGILGLSTLDGIAITDFTAISSSSGFDYAHAFAQSVPEPTICTTMGVGLALMGWLRRRKKSQAAP